MPTAGNSRPQAAAAAVAAVQPARSGTFGERLRREREMRGIKLEEIAESTKIGKRNLQALEDERFDQLPGGIFNKGFVRAYAKFLGLDEEQAVNDFLAASANYEQPEALQPPSGSSAIRPAAIPSDTEVRRKERRWAVAALLILLLAGVIYWKWKPMLRPQLTPHQQRAATLPPTSPAHARSPATPTPASEAQAQQPVAAAPQAPQVATSSLAAKSESTSGKASSSAPIATQSAPAASAAIGVTLSVHANEQTWVSATADGQPLLDAVLQRGDTRELHAKSELVLKTGNAAGLDVSFNGQPLPVLGKEKEVKTLTFTAEGLQH